MAQPLQLSNGMWTEQRTVALRVAITSATALLLTVPVFVAGGAVLWRDPGAVASKDLFWGNGGRAEAPRPPFTFVDEDLSGTKPKVRVTDARGTKWNVKS